MAQRNKVGMLREAIHHRQDDALSIDARQPLDEVERDVCPDLGGHLEGLKKAGRVQCLSLVPLTHGARADKVLDQPAIVVDDEVAAQML
jgi:hypothetical protein